MKANHNWQRLTQISDADVKDRLLKANHNQITTRVETENANNPHGEGPIDPNNFAPLPKNPAIAKFFIQLGRVDELGSGVLNVNKYIREYSGSDSPQFIEGSIFKVIIPVGGGISHETEGLMRD